ncbi:MAG: choice-of-anchor L domain-containing protein [Saprospiraceae bacterium]
MAIKTGWMALVILLLQSTSLVALNPNSQTADTLNVSQLPQRFMLDIIDQQRITLSGIQKGEQYQLFLNKDLTNDKGLPDLYAEEGVLNWRTTPNGMMSFTASSATPSFVIVLLGAETDFTEIPVVLSVDCITCQTENKLEAMGFMTPIVTDNSYTPEQLVQDVFVGGDCFSVDEASISFSGSALSRGYYSNGSTSVDMEEGVMLLTGNIATAVGPNNLNNAGSSTFSSNNDPDLQALLPNGTGNLNDVTALEFDFTPTTDNVSFEFVFASEEYCEYVGSIFNDVFGFFISGPGINGPFANNAANIALIPGSNANVAINNVNHVDNNNYYLNNMSANQIDGLSNDSDCDGLPAVDGIAINDFQFDGLTTVLTAESEVQACETYHIKLVIADVGDAYYDSAVFFKANSFDAGGNATVDIQSPNTNVPNTVYENCGADGFFLFTRADDDLSVPLTVNFQIAPSSTATAGVDYTTLPTSITIPAGDSVYQLPVEVLSDAIAENVETIRLELDVSCSCDMPFIEMQIIDQEPLEVLLDGASACGGASMVTLAPEVTGGLPGYTYQWSNNASTSTIDVFANNTATYVLTVTDLCGNEVISSADVLITPLPSAMISGTEEICPGGMLADLQIDFTGDGPWDFSYSINNAAPIDINNITDNPFVLQTSESGNFTLTAIAENGCEGTVQGLATVSEYTLDLTSSSTQVNCPDWDDGSIEVVVTSGEGPYIYDWDNPLAVGQNPDNLPVGVYNVQVTDANGCQATLSENVNLTPDVPTAEAGQSTDLTCTTTQLTLLGSGSSGNLYSQSWSSLDGNIISANNTFTPLINQPGTYVLSVSNTVTGCVMTDEITIAVDTISPVASIEVQGPTSLDCNQTQTTLAGTNSQPFGQINYEWSTQDGNIPQDQMNLPNIEVQSPGTYQLEVTNLFNGCTDMDEMSITQDVELPEVNISLPDLLTCDTLQTIIDASASSNASNFIYAWSTVDGNILSGNNTLHPLVDQPGSYSITITNTSNNCTQDGSITVNQDIVPPVANAGETPELLDCNTETVNLDGSDSSTGNQFTYSWITINGNIISSNNTLTPTVDAGGLYSLTVENQMNGCTASDDVQVVENTEKPTDLYLLPISPLCHGEPGSVAATEVTGGISPYVYSLDGGNTFYGDTLFGGLSPGPVSVIVQDVNGCQFEAQTIIPDVVPLTLILENEVTIGLGGEHQLNAYTNIPDTKIDTIIWTNTNTLDCIDCLDPIAAPVENTLYEIVLVDTNGCVAEADILLRIDKQRNVFIPNAFSPNGDGNNDVFMIFAKSESVKSINEFQLFNRWGEKVFELKDFQPNDPRNGWDGYFNGKRVNPSVLVYFAEIEFVDGFKKMYKGDFTLMD